MLTIHEADETVFDALKRELFEELDIRVMIAKPFIKVEYDYPDKLILLDVWHVTRFVGTPRGKEGQPIMWINHSDLEANDFPAANKAIVYALKDSLNHDIV